MQEEKPREDDTRSFSVERARTKNLRAVIQIRRVATELSAAAKRELTQRTEPLNSRLLVGHTILQRIVVGLPSPGSVARPAPVDFARPVPLRAMRSPHEERLNADRRAALSGSSRANYGSAATGSCAERRRNSHTPWR